MLSKWSPKMLCACLVHRIQIRILYSNPKNRGSHIKKNVWYMRFKWGLKSQLEFYVDPMPILSSAFHLFLNPSRIQIRTQFFCGSQFITVSGPIFFFSPIFSLSLSPLVLLKNNYLRTKRISKKQKEEKPEVSYCRKKNRSIICNFSHTSIHLSRFILNSSRIISSRHRFSGRCCPKMYYFPRVSSEVKVLLMWLAGFSGHFDCCQILL